MERIKNLKSDEKQKFVIKKVLEIDDKNVKLERSNGKIEVIPKTEFIKEMNTKIAPICVHFNQTVAKVGLSILNLAQKRITDDMSKKKIVAVNKNQIRKYLHDVGVSLKIQW